MTLAIFIVAVLVLEMIYFARNMNRQEFVGMMLVAGIGLVIGGWVALLNLLARLP